MRAKTSFPMIRVSFRQSMLAGLLLIVALLGGASVRSWYLLEHFAAQSRANGALALRISASTQELAERTTELERSARQYMVLGDPGVLARFDAQLTHALGAIGNLDSLPGQPLASLPVDWRRAADELGTSLHRKDAEENLANALTRLATINAALDAQGKRWIENQHGALLGELEENRLRLGTLVVAAIATAFLIALAMSWWLSRPIDTIEEAIERLGESRLGDPVEVGGPADLRQIGKRLDWLRVRLGELEAEREKTLRHVSHELKTPLTALREGVALLQEEIAGPLTAAQREVADILDANARSLQGHIESLLRLNAVSLGTRRVHRRPVNLKRLLGEVVQERELQVQARRVQIQCNAPSTPGLEDADKLRVIIDNLLSNAIDFSPDGGVVRLDARIDGPRLRLSCIDQGPGVAAEDAQRIFSPFVQGLRPAPVPRQGSGVGLSIVRELVTVMGGRIELVTPGSSGAHFEIELPWTPAS